MTHVTLKFGSCLLIAVRIAVRFHPGLLKKEHDQHMSYHVAVGAEGIRVETSTGFTSTVGSEVPVIGGALVTVMSNDVLLAGALSRLFITLTHSISAGVRRSACSYTSTACRVKQRAELNINALIHF